MPNKKKLYEALKQEGYTNFADEKSFNDYINDADNRKTLFNALKEEGYDNFADEAEFDDYLGYSAPIQPTTNPPIHGGVGTQEEADSIFDANMKRFQEGKPIERVSVRNAGDYTYNVSEDRPSLQEQVKDSKMVFSRVEDMPWNRPQGGKDGHVSNEDLGYRLKKVYEEGGMEPFMHQEEDAKVKEEYKAKPVKTTDDVWNTAKDKFALTERGQRLQSELADIQKGVSDKYMAEFMKSKEYQEYVNKKYTTQEEADNANKAINELFGQMYGNAIIEDMKPYVEAYNNEVYNRYEPEIETGLKSVAKADASANLNTLSASVDEELTSIEEQITNRRDAVRNADWKPGMPSKRDDRQLAELRGQRTYLEGAKELIEESQQIVDAANAEKDGNFFGGLGRGVRDTTFDLDNWTMGLSDLVGGLRLKSVLEKAEKGEELTKAEESLLDASVNNMAINYYFGSDLGRGYKAGQVTGESLPFILEMIINPISGSGNAIAKSLLKHGIKKFGRVATTDAAKFGGRLVGDALAASGMASTTGMPAVLGEAVQRMNENYDYNFDEEGNLKVSKVGDTSFGEAMVKSFATRAIENQSEMIFNAFGKWSPLNSIAKNVGDVLPDGVNGFINRIKNSKPAEWYREIKNNPTLREVAQRAQFHGLPEEYFEEVYNNFANVALGEMTMDEALDLDNNIDTFIGLAPMSVAFGMVGLGGMAVERYNNRKKLERIFGRMTDEQKAKLKELQEMGKLQENTDIREFIKATMADESLTPEQKREEIEYAYEIAKNNAMNEVTGAETEDTIESQNAAIDAATDPQTGMYGEVHVKRFDGKGEEVQVPANVFGEKIVNGELYLLVQEEGSDEKYWVKPSQYYAETYQSLPAEEVKAEAAEIVREEAERRMAEESKYAPEVINAQMQQNVPFETADAKYVPIQPMLEGSGWQVEVYAKDENGKPAKMPVIEEMSNDAYRDILQQQYEQNEAVQEEAAKVEASNQEIVANMPTKAFNDGTGRVAQPVAVQGNEVTYNIADANGTVLEQGTMDVAKFNEMEDAAPVQETVGQSETAQEGAVEVNPMAEAAESVSNEEVEQPQAAQQAPVIPTKADGSVDFVTYGKDNTFRELGNRYGEKMPNKVAVTVKALAEDLAKAQKKLDKAQEDYDNAPIGREDKAEKVLNKAREEFEAVKREADFWTEMDTEVKQAQAKREALLNARMEELGYEPMSADEFIAQQLANGNITLLSDSFKKETGFGENERNKFLQMFRTLENGGMSIEEAGDVLMQMDREAGTNFFDQSDANAGRDALINFLGSVAKWGDVTGYIRNNRQAQAMKEAEGIYNEVEDAIMRAYHTTLEDYVNQMEAAEVENPFLQERPEEIMAIFAEEAAKYEQSLNNIDNGQAEGNITEGSGTILAEEQADNTGGTEEQQESQRNGLGTPEESESAHDGEQGQVEEKKNLQEKVLSWLSENNLEWAEGKSLSEIIEQFGNEVEPIAVIPDKAIDIFGENVSRYLYSGKGYMIDHAVNHHPELSTEDYLLIQDILDNYDDIKDLSSNGKTKAAFVKKLDKGYAVVVELSEKDGKILLHKTFFYRDGNSSRTPYKNKPSFETKSSVDGSTTISHAEKHPADTENISALDDVSTDKDSNLSEENKENGKNVAELKQKEGESILQFAERVAEENRRRPLRKRANEWSKALGVKVTFLESIDEVDAETRAQIEAEHAKGSGVPAWVDPNGEVYFFMPDLRNVKDVDETYIHEVVAHIGLEKLLGKERFAELCDKVWDMMPQSEKDYYEKEYPGVKNIQNETKRHRAAADEYMAHLAEKESLTPEEQTIWDKIVKYMRDVLDRALNGMLSKSNITNEDISNLIKMSYANLKSGNTENVGGEGTRFRFSKTPQEFDAIQKEAVEKKGIVMPGLNEAVVDVLSIDKHDFNGNLKQAREAAKQWAIENYQGKEFSLPDNGGSYTIGKKAINKYVDKASIDKSDNAMIHLSALKELPNIISSSITGEIHADYKKGKNGQRSADNGVGDKGLLIHRMFGTIELDGKVYRVKTTMNEYRDPMANNTPHSYEVTEIELIESSSTPSLKDDSKPVNVSNNSITAANLLNGVEKSYDKGKKLLDESEKTLFRTVYHGSAASFDKFDHSFMSTGEGNQSYGWGTYLTDVESIGKQYANMYAKNSPLAANALRWIEENGTYDDFLAQGEGKRRNWAIRQAKDYLKELKKDGASEDVIKAYEQDLVDAENALSEENYNRTKENMIASLNRNLYTVDIPDNDGTNYIAWDKPLSEDNKRRIKDAVLNSQMYKDYAAKYGDDVSLERLNSWLNAFDAGRVYRLLENFADNEDGTESAKQISLLLSDAGFTGFEYPANYLSGGNLEGAKNYVIFNEHDLDIVEHTRFRTKKDDRELVAIHNISEDNLRKVLSVGGLIMPSIAITKADMGHEGYGEISLLFDKETINPSDRRNKVYGGDAWTPRFPQTTAKINDKISSKVRNKIRGLIDDRALSELYSLSAEMHPDNIERNISNKGVEGYYNEQYMKHAYLLDNGKKVKVPMRMKDYGDMSETIIEMAKERGLTVSDIQQDSFDFYQNNPDFVNAVKMAVNEKKLNSFPEEKRETFRNFLGKEEMRFLYFDTLISAATRMEYDLEHGGLKQIIDKAALRESIEKKVKTNNADYNKWVDNLFEGIVEKYGIRNDRDWYTPSGNLRPWNQLYDDATPANILRHMLAENEQGGSGGFFDSNIMGASTETYGSIEEIREKGKKRLRRLDEGEYDEWSNSVAERMSEICYDFLSPSQRNEFGASIDAKVAITNAVAKDKTAKGIYKAMKRDYPGFTMEHAKQVEEIVKEIQDFAIGYFEAKPRRIVPISEVRKAVVPKNTSKDILEGLKDNGIDVATYKSGDEAARARLIKKESNGIRFRMTNKEKEELRDSEETKALFDYAKKRFGRTFDLREAGYILPDGAMLDFSGRHEMSPGSDTSFLKGQRSVDHRYVADLNYETEDNGGEKTAFNTDMADFINRGAIRIDGNVGSINLTMIPTKDQKAILQRMIQRLDGDVWVDFSEGWDTEHSAEYSGVRPFKVLGDIDRYYNEGVKPEGSTRFRFIGEKGAANLDKAEEATTRLDNLSVAREMEAVFNAKKKRIEKLKDSEPIVAEWKDYDGSYELNNRSAADYINNELRGEYTNKDTGNQIKITRKGAFKVTRHDAESDVHLKSIALIPQMIEESIFIEELPNLKGGTGFDSYRYYVVGLNLDGVDYTAKLAVGTKNGETYYDHSLTEIEKTNLIERRDEISSSFTDNEAVNPYRKDKRLISILQTNDKENAKKIKMATGWERGADGKWRYEVDDNIDFELRRPRKAELKKAYDEANEKYYKLEMRVPVRTPKNASEEDKKRIKDLRKELAKLRKAMNKAFEAYYDYSADWVTLGDFLGKDNQLFKEYPELANYDVSFLRDTSKLSQGLKGSFTPEYKTIWLDDARPKGDIKSSLIHEIQHAIQGLEGFAQGGTPQMFAVAKYHAEDGKANFREFINRYGFEDWEKNLPFEELMRYGKLYKGMFGGLHRAFIETQVEDESIKETLMKELEYVKEAYDKLYYIAGGQDAAYKFKDANEWYRSLSGEVEARNVQQRMGMTDEQRRNSLAESTEDVEREDQIFLKDAIENGQTMFRVKREKIQEEVDKFTSKYKSAPVNVIDKNITEEEFKEWIGDEVTKDEFFKWLPMSKSTGGYVRAKGKIVIFADKVKRRKDVEKILFHENLHVVVANNEIKELMDNFYGKAKDKREFARWKKLSDSDEYLPSERVEEFFVYSVSNGQLKGDLEDVFKQLSSNEQKQLLNLLKDNGYVYEEEAERRRTVLGRLRNWGRSVQKILGEKAERQKERSRRSREEAERLKQLFDKVADMGLDGVLGNKDYINLMVDIYNAIPEDVRIQVAGDALRHYGGDVAPAVSDYINVKAKADLWDKVVGFVKEALRKAGFDLNLTANDVKYIMWRSQKPINRESILDMAEDIDKKYTLGVGEYENSPTRFRAKKGSGVKVDADEYAKISYQIATYPNKVDRGHVFTDNNYYLCTDIDEEGNFKVVAQLKIEGNEELINRLRGENGRSNFKAIEGTEDIASTVAEVRSRGGRTDRNIPTSKRQSKINRRNDSVHLGQQTDPTTDKQSSDSNDGKRTSFRITNKLQVRDEYEALMKKGGYQAREAVQDAMLSLRRVQEMIEKATGKKLRGFENAWMHENRLSSVVQAEIQDMEKKFYKPMIGAVKKFMDAAHLKDTEVADYLMLKHQIERNREMAVRKALTDDEGKLDRTRLEQWYKDKRDIRNDANLPTWREKQEAMDAAALNYGADMSVDYSGLTSMFDTDDLAYCTDKAYLEVEALEKGYQSETEALNNAVKAMNQNTLDAAFGSGLMDRKVYDELSNDMYDYYIPLRGFEETTSDEVYAYMDNDRGAFNAPLRRAYGRTSKSDNPLAYMKSIAESGIMQGNRNKMKQTFLNMVLNNPSDLVSVKEGVWAVFNPATGEWEAASAPAIPDNATPADVEAIMEQWEQSMEQQAANNANVKKIREADDIPYRVIGNRISQHQVIVKRLGKSYTLTINGNPRLAMALNGQTNPNNTSNDGKVAAYVSGKIDSMNRFLSAWYTTRNPDFVASNFMRDTFYTNTIVRAKEGNKYANKFHKHYVELLMPGRMMNLFRKYESGTLDPSDKLEKNFLDFMMNGGETGYSNLKDLEHIKKRISKELKGSKWLQVEKVAEKLDIINRAVENTSRFAAFLTSREMGRGIEQSVFDAKEISVNFNKKGAGGTFFGMTGQTKFGNLAAMVGAGGRAMYVFFNAAIQGTTNLMHVMRKNPVGTSAGIAAMFLMGAVIPFLLDDDDEKDYYDIPEYVRRSHLILPGSGDAWVSIPLPIEYRIMYGMGELLTSWRTGHERGSDIARKMLNLTGQALPLNFMEEGLDAFVPSAVSPLWQSYTNTSWTGLPIYRESDFNKDDPEYTKVYKNTDRNFVKFTKALYEWTFDEENLEAGIDLNPAIMETIARGYFGGAFTTMNNLAKTWSIIEGDREFDWRNIPIANRIMKSGNEQTKEKRIANEYFNNIEKLEFLQSRERTLKKTRNGIAVPEKDRRSAEDDLNQMIDTEVYKKYQNFKAAKKKVDKIHAKMKKDGETEELRKKLTELQEEANGKVR